MAVKLWNARLMLMLLFLLEVVVFCGLVRTPRAGFIHAFGLVPLSSPAYQKGRYGRYRNRCYATSDADANCRAR